MQDAAAPEDGRLLRLLLLRLGALPAGSGSEDHSLLPLIFGTARAMKKELRESLQAIFGPRSWAERALRSAGISPQHAQRLGLGSGRRHCLTMEKLVESQLEEAEREPQSSKPGDADYRKP